MGFPALKSQFGQASEHREQGLDDKLQAEMISQQALSGQDSGYTTRESAAKSAQHTANNPNEKSRRERDAATHTHLQLIAAQQLEDLLDEAERINDQLDASLNVLDLIENGTLDRNNEEHHLLLLRAGLDPNDSIDDIRDQLDQQIPALMNRRDNVLDQARANAQNLSAEDYESATQRIEAAGQENASRLDQFNAEFSVATNKVTAAPQVNFNF